MSGVTSGKTDHREVFVSRRSKRNLVEEPRNASLTCPFYRWERPPGSTQSLGTHTKAQDPSSSSQDGPELLDKDVHDPLIRAAAPKQAGRPACGPHSCKSAPCEQVLCLFFAVSPSLQNSAWHQEAWSHALSQCNSPAVL